MTPLKYPTPRTVANPAPRDRVPRRRVSPNAANGNKNSIASLFLALPAGGQQQPLLPVPDFGQRRSDLGVGQKRQVEARWDRPVAGGHRLDGVRPGEPVPQPGPDPGDEVVVDFDE